VTDARSPCVTQRRLAATDVKLAGLGNVSRDVANGEISIILSCPRDGFDGPSVAIRKTYQDGHRLVANLCAIRCDRHANEPSGCRMTAVTTMFVTEPPHLDERLEKQVLDETWLPDVKEPPLPEDTLASGARALQ